MPDRTDLADRVVNGGFFLTRRDEGTQTPFTEPDNGERTPKWGHGYRHCFTYIGSPRTIRRELLAIVTAARRKIFVASFLLGDTELTAALAAAAERLRGGVYVITQLDENRLRRGLAELGENNDEADLQAQKKRFDQMTRQGIYVRGHANCHAKFVVADDETALVTSANLMTRALDDTGENGVVVTERSEVDRLSRLFARLWHAGCQWEAYPGEAYALRRYAPQPWPAPVPPPTVGPMPGLIWTDGPDQRFLLQSIRDIIARARDDLLIATFSLNGLRKDQAMLLDTILDAVTRGVRVRLLLRPRRHDTEHVQDAELLVANGVEVYGDQLTHAKAVFADDRHGAVFSANLDAKKGLTTGVEVGCRLDGVAALPEARRYIEHAVDQAALTFTVNPTHRELSAKLDAPWRTPWPLEEHITVTATEQDRTEFLRATSKGPILFTTATQQPLTLHADRRRWHLTGERPGHYKLTVAAAQPNPMTAAEKLAKWLVTPGVRHRGGVCAAVIEWAPPLDREPS